MDNKTNNKAKYVSVNLFLQLPIADLELKINPKEVQRVYYTPLRTFFTLDKSIMVPKKLTTFGYVLGMTKNRFLKGIRHYLQNYVDSISFKGVKISENPKTPILWGLTFQMIVFLLQASLKLSQQHSEIKMDVTEL